MSYAIVRVQKFSAGSVGGIQIHDKRLKEGISHTNQDIDWARTDLNYNLAKDKTNSYHQVIKQRISSLALTRAVRKDAVVMVQCLVTSDKTFFDGLSPEQTRNFFQESYEWLCERYGSENVISANVHMDERTPHMHFNFVPVTADGRLSAKSILTKQSLIQQQDDFLKQIGSRYNLQRGEKGGNKRHLDVVEYKLATAQEIKAMEIKKTDLSNEIKALQGEILSASQIMSIQPKKGVMGGLKDITLEEFNNVKSMAIRYTSTSYELATLKNDYLKLQNKMRQPLDMHQQLIALQRDKSDLEEKYDYLKFKIRRVEKAINSDQDLKNRFEVAMNETSILNTGRKKEKEPQLTR